MQRAREYTAAAALIAVILYLSLYPFQWRLHVAAAGPFAVFTKPWRSWPEDPGDFLANIAFYMPGGYFIARCFTTRMSAPVRLVATVLLCAALSATLELTQFYIARRYSDIRDTYANVIGALIGATASLILDATERNPVVARVKQNPFPSLLLAAFLSARLYPYTPSLDLHKYLDALRPLRAFVFPSPDELFLQTACWMAVYSILRYVFGVRSTVALFIGMAALVFGAEILVGTEVHVDELYGAILALPLSFILVSVLPRPALWLAVIFTAAVVVERLQPFDFSAHSHGFGWFPFGALVRGTNEHTLTTISDKSFLYGTLIWLWAEAGFSRSGAVLGVPLLLLVCSFADRYIPGRVAETTDAVIGLLLGGFMLFVSRPAARGSCVHGHPLK